MGWLIMILLSNPEYVHFSIAIVLFFALTPPHFSLLLLPNRILYILYMTVY